MNKKILLVEDEVVIALNEQSELQKYGYTTIHEVNGENAINRVKTDSSEIDLILMDINLGYGIDGTEAAEKILKIADIPIVFLSSHTNPEIVEKTEKITSYGYVVKHTGITVLDTAIKMAFKLFYEKQENKKHQNQLFDSEEMFRELFEQSIGYCLILDPNTDDGIPLIVDANKAACMIHGYKKEEFIGRPVADINYEDGKEKIRTRTAEIMTGKPFYVENIHTRKDGTTFPVAVNAKRINFKNKPPLIISTEYDITEQKEIEDKKKKLIEEKELLLKEVHHRVKNNIFSIESMLKLNLQDIKDDHSSDIIKQAVSQVEIMRILYDKLLISDDFGKISIKDYISSLIKSLKELYTNNQAINITYNIADIVIEAKTISTIGFIATELITNSVKHGFKNKTKGNINFSLEKVEDYIIIQITDDGIGFPEDFSIEKSAGFGIDLVKALTAQLYGNFSIDNINGTKCTVTFIL